MKNKFSVFRFSIFFLLYYSFNGAFANYETYQHGSGLFLIVNTQNSNNASLQVCFRFGSVFEDDSSSGSSALLAKLVLKQLRQAPALNTTTINAAIEPEMVSFKINCKSEQLEKVIMAIRKYVFEFNSTEADISSIQSEILNDNNGRDDIPNNQLKKLLWGNDFYKVLPYGNVGQVQRFNLAFLKTIFAKYLQPSNAILCVASPYPRSNIVTWVNTIFSESNIKIFNPERITHIMEFKPIVNTQVLLFHQEDMTEVSGLVFQNPGARYDRRGSYCAYVVNQMLEDARIDTTMSFNYSANNYFGTFTISDQVKNRNYRTSQLKLMSLVQNIQQLRILNPEAIEKAKDGIINKFKSVSTSAPEYLMKEMAYFRFLNDENFILSFADSIQSVKMADLKQYINDYFVNRAGIMYTQSTTSPETNNDTSERVYELNGNFSDTKCMFELNKTDLYGDSNWTNIQRLIYWLKLNQDAHLQINGYADEGEYNRVRDESLQQFIDSIPTFRKAMPDFIKTGYMRPEAMRALKLMKVFYEAGVSLNRITGTSMLFTSDTKEEAAENRKCTFTVEKNKPTIYIREAHNPIKY